jgi:hypothetical protein
MRKMKKNFYIILLMLLSNLFLNRINAQQTNGANIILNPSFDTDDTGWGNYFDYFWDPTNPLAASANVSVIIKAGYAGNAYKVAIFNAGTADYSVQISYPVALGAGKKYAINFKASADAARTITLSMQQNDGPKTTWYSSNPIALTTTPAVYGPYEFTATNTDPSNLFKFYMGGGGASGAISTYFDDVEVKEIIDVPGATVPGAPTIGTAIAGNGRATVSFTAPANNGGIPVKSYTVTSNPGVITATATAGPITVNGLTNGQAYTFTVVAANALGAGVASAASNSVTPIFKPVSYYVSSMAGSDNNNGTTEVSPFATIAKASSVMIAGDTALIMTGVYEPLTITKSGNAAANITYKAYPNNNPVITCGANGAWNLLQLSASYITVDGLEVKGINQSLTLAQGEANYNNVLAAINAGTAPDYQSTTNTNTNGVSIGDKNIATVHHVIVKNCRVHDCSAGGLGGTNADYLTIENNEIYNNAWYTMWAPSGISFLNVKSIDVNTGEKIIIRGNKVYNNYCLVKWIEKKDYSDGNGIIIDVNTGYTASFLIENNLVFDNGGRGLYIIEAGNATFRNNTSYWNSKSAFSTGGEMVCYNVHDVKYVNNLAWANPAYSSENFAICDNGNWGTNSNITWKNNLAFNGTEGQNATYLNRTSTTSVDNTNKTGVNPMFVNLSINPATANFKVQAGSPVIDAGTSAFGVSVYDIAYSVRVQGNSVDLGAYESNPSSPLPVTLLSFTAKRTGAFNAVLSWITTGEVNFNFFDLEKADDGQTFIKLASISSGSLSKNNYQYTDNNATARRSYYRLKMIDQDGSFRYSNIVVLTLGEYENNVTEFYPNPVVNQSATINVLAKEAGVWTVSTTNIIGQSINLQKNTLTKGLNQLKVNLAALTAGVHFLKIENNGEVFIRRMIKN